MMGAKLILRGILGRPHQVAQRFVLGIGHPQGRQVAGAVAARQPSGIPAAGLDQVAGFDRASQDPTLLSVCGSVPSGSE
jgi:hypothetical protein